jgi:molybdopterin-biosynthesis enzyme MoeA-like protein
MNIGLIIVGDEILSGKRQDKHLAKVIELLAARGPDALLGALRGR